MTREYAVKEGAKENMGGHEEPQCLMASLWLLTSPGMIVGLVVEGNPMFFHFYPCYSYIKVWVLLSLPLSLPNILDSIEK